MGYTLVPLPPQSPDRLSVSVREITSRWDLRRAAGLQRRINKGDRYWTAPPRAALRRALAARYVTEGECGRLAVFIAEAQSAIQADQVIGTIAAWVVEEPDEGLAARFGLFEVINEPEIAERLIEAAETWLLAQFPVGAIRGPYSLDDRQPSGLLTSGFNVRPAPGLPYNPPYYPEIVERAGYSAWQTACTYLLPARASSDPPQVHITGETAMGCSIAWEEAGEQTATLTVAPDLPRFLPQLRQGFIRPSAQRRPARRLLARPIASGDEPVRNDPRLALCRAAAGAAARLGYHEVLLGPVPDAEEGLRAGLLALGAQPAHTYQLFEKAI